MHHLGSTPCALVWKMLPGRKGRAAWGSLICLPPLRDGNLRLPVNDRLQNVVLYILVSFLGNRVKMSLYKLIYRGWKWNRNHIISFYTFLHHILVLFKCIYIYNSLLLFLTIIYIVFKIILYFFCMLSFTKFYSYNLPLFLNFPWNLVLASIALTASCQPVILWKSLRKKTR